ncbi:unnamed protein product [Spirodela intermedia]|uniref:EF-hand domain-containing protein n=1 Tax=Spirodela intermedia TaxID=51605 RepID=A0A7I8L6E5_SPIIN|nr:unnamed protein product [Spirodela intermedia]
MAAGGAATSFPRPLKWLSRLSLPRRRHLNPSPTVTSPVNGITAAVGCGGNCGFSEAFRRFDANGDGKISGEELLSFLLSAGEDVGVKDVEKLVGEFDSDGDGFIDYVDFVRLVSDGGEVDGDLRAVFEMFIAEKGGGFITPKGLRRVLRRLGETASHEECAAMIRAFDGDGDGVLNYDEFCKMMM